MSSSRLRLIAIPLALLAFGLRLGAAFWWSPVAWEHASPGNSVLLIIAAYPVTLGIPVLVFAAVVRRWYRQRPAALQVTGRAFVAPSRSAINGELAILLMWITGGLLVTERVPGQAAARIAQFDYALTVSIAGLVLGVLMSGLTLVIRSPRAVLEPTGLTIVNLWRRTLRWDELAPGGPLPPQRPGLRVMLLYRITPPGVRSVPVGLPVAGMHVDPVFLAGAIRHYVEHPEHRAAIGSEAEYERLRALLTPVAAAV